MTGVLAMLLLAAAQPAATDAAREPAPGPVIEEIVEVTADAPDDEDVAAFSSTIDGDELTGRGVDLADVLRRVPGARVRDYGGLGSYATVSVRASTPEQVVVLVDGVPRNRALGGAVDLSSIPASQIESITVFRGFAPASLGYSGIGGVVDVRTRTGAANAGGGVDVIAGELHTARLAGGWAFPIGEDGRLAVGVESLQSDGDFRYLDTGTIPDFDPGDDVVVRRENNRLTQGSVDLRYSKSGVARGDLAVGLRAQDRERGVPGPDGNLSRTAELDESLAELQASWSAPLASDRAWVELAAQAFREENRFDDPQGLRATDARTVLDGGGLSASFRWDLERHRWLVRADVRSEEADTEDRALDVEDRGGARRLSSAWTVEDMFTVGRVTLAPSARWETRDDEFLAGASGIVHPRADDVREDELSGKIGIAVALAPRVTLRGSAGSFFRAPSLVELFGDRGSLRGNPRLASERGESFELGLGFRSRSRRWSAEIVGFARRTDDLIVLEPQSQGVLVPFNLARAEVEGVEVDLSTTPLPGLTLDASLTIQDPRDTSGSRNVPLPFEPEELGWLGASLRRGRLGARWEVTYVGSNAFQDERIDSRTIHDAHVSWSAGAGFELGLDVRNAFDRMTRDVARYPLPDRVIAFQVGWRSAGSGS